MGFREVKKLYHFTLISNRHRAVYVGARLPPLPEPLSLWDESKAVPKAAELPVLDGVEYHVIKPYEFNTLEFDGPRCQLQGSRRPICHIIVIQACGSWGCALFFSAHRYRRPRQLYLAGRRTPRHAERGPHLHALDQQLPCPLQSCLVARTAEPLDLRQVTVSLATLQLDRQEDANQL